ncbi:T-cell immunoreceptor with Ig and ITIM domains [Dasypus novemcinctus]|uniref:T-cell immunoreceptor with Ig and ITIM domains n=1 Tax=Dasypus novemcinctus TaxID=9361 RepID=UPI000C825FD3|nr:T-cell immunoreceptor with Ig and ITIM domains [Dasypus novemcinctus]
MCFLHGLSCGSPHAACVLVKALSVFDIVFAELIFSETLSHQIHPPSCSRPVSVAEEAASASCGPLGRSMQWCLLLIWAQGLRQAPLPASGAVTGRIVTVGNISAEEGSSVTLQCHLSSTTAKVSQVNWERPNQPLARHHADLGWHVYPAFSERVVPGPSLGLTFQLLTTNDTGEYFCIYHTYPDGIYQGRIFLEVLGSSVAEPSAGFQILLLGAMGTVLAVICVAVIGAVTLARKKSLRIQSAESGLGRMPSEQEDWTPRVLSAPGSCIQAEAAPADLRRAQREDDSAEPHDYFNVLSYRSLGSFSFPVETG